MTLKLPNTLTFRLTFWYAAAFAFFLVVAFYFSYFLIDTNLNNEISDELTEDIAEYRKILDEGGINRVIDEIERDVKTTDTNDEFIRLLDINGRLIYSSNMTQWQGLNTDQDFIGEIKMASLNSGPLIKTVRIPGREYNIRIAHARIGPDTELLIGESLEQTDELLDLLLSIFAVMFCVVIPIASAVGWLVAKHAVSGIEEVSQAAIAIKNGNLDHRVSVKAQRDEIQNLADTFNSMAVRIKELITEMREMIDNIAHDLRSPLSRIRVISEMTLSSSDGNTDYKSAAANTLEECDRLIQLINSTLDVAEAESGVGNSPKEHVDMSELAEEACELFEPVAEEKNIKISVKLEPDCRLYGSKHNLQRMIANLLDNALKYTPPEGKVRINLDKNSHDIMITVTDTGIGIPLSDQQRVFERFFRCDHSRSEEGCGLGLSFSRAVARAHGGDITMTSIPGESSTFIINLPIDSSNTRTP
jgi:Signal transduction histidine kinase